MMKIKTRWDGMKGERFMDRQSVIRALTEGKAVLGMELGSTRIKAVLIGEDHEPVATGGYSWENRLEDGVWTYHLEDVWTGVQSAYADLKRDVREKYGVTLEKLGGIGISAMMHGYLVFDAEGKQLAQFRTWRNTMTGEASRELTRLFHFNIPQRWSIAHLYQAMLNREEHVSRIARLTTLSGYLHEQLSGVNVVGAGEASGMMPLDSEKCDFDQPTVELFDEKVRAAGYLWNLRGILPRVANAGEDAGVLTADGAKRLDPEGDLQPGAPMCPPEGDAGTGMVATNSVNVRTGNVSAGTSAFAMVVLEKPLARVHEEIDMVTTPDGKPVAMVHCNNCTSDINAWAKMLHGFAQAAGVPCDMNAVYTAIFEQALAGEKDCGGMVNVNYFSGEHLTGLTEGRPMLVRMPDTQPSFANLARSLVYGAIVTLKLGMDILVEQEHVKIDSLLGHGGFFKTGCAGQKLLAAALNTPVSVMATASEGGAWGMALLAAYRVNRRADEKLDEYLNNRVFAKSESKIAQPEAENVEGFARYAKRFVQALEAEKAAVEGMK